MVHRCRVNRSGLMFVYQSLANNTQPCGSCHSEHQNHRLDCKCSGRRQRTIPCYGNGYVFEQTRSGLLFRKCHHGLHSNLMGGLPKQNLTFIHFPRSSHNSSCTICIFSFHQTASFNVIDDLHLGIHDMGNWKGCRPHSEEL